LNLNLIPFSKLALIAGMPLVKLGYLLIRTIAKPIGSGIKRQAREHPSFRNACIVIAQSYHRAEIRLKRGLEANKKRLPLPHNRPLHGVDTDIEPIIRPLDESKAVEVGSEFIGEALVFIVAGTLLVMDQLSNRRKEREKTAEVERRFNELYSEMALLKRQLENNPNKS
jgi:hypothetical protein